MMFAEVVPTSSLLASAGGFLVAVVIPIGATCWKVSRWIDRADDRARDLDVVRLDWAARGLTAAGAIKEDTKYRATVDVHTEAIAGQATTIAEQGKRLDAHDGVLAGFGNQLDTIEERLEEIAHAVRQGGEIDELGRAGRVNRRT